MQGGQNVDDSNIVPDNYVTKIALIGPCDVSDHTTYFLMQASIKEGRCNATCTLVPVAGSCSGLWANRESNIFTHQLSSILHPYYIITPHGVKKYLPTKVALSRAAEVKKKVKHEL
jgi:hypothetical protein